MEELKHITINENGRIYLGGEELKNVTAYKLESSAKLGGPAKLTVEMLVTVDRVASGS